MSKPRSIDQHRMCETCGTAFYKPRNVARQIWEKRRFCSRDCIQFVKTHGEAWKTPEYAIWQAMIQRCTNPKNRNWHKYGGRGIAVCEAWRHSYQSFIDDMGRRPTDKHSIERVNNGNGYSPENCCWATIDAQANNTRWNRVLLHDGRTQTIAQWAAERHIKPNTIVTRLRYGWHVDRALSEKTNTRYRTMRAKP